MTVQQWQQPQDPAPVPVTVAAGVVSLLDEAQKMSAAYTIAQRATETSFCPAAFRNKAPDAAMAILAGSEVGLSPIAALNAYDVIEGRPALRANAIRAITQSQGHELELVESTDTKCKMRGRRRGSDTWQTVLWTIDRARQMGLLSKSNWQKMPAAMLIARATSECARLIASDALLGLGGGYSAEELADGDGPAPVMVVQQAPAQQAEPRRLAYRPAAVRETVEEAADPETGEVVIDDRIGKFGDPETDVVTSAPPQRRTLGRRTPAQAQASIEEQQTEIRELHEELREVEQSLPAVDPPAEPVEKITKPQMGKVMAMFTRLGIENRDERLDYCGFVVGRKISSTTDMTKREAMKLIDHLEGIDGPVDAAAAVAGEDAIGAEVVDDESNP